MSTNFDQQELNKFAALAKEWWDPEGAFNPLHAINPLRLQFIRDNVDLNHKKVIDVGCGGGILTESLAQAGADVIGIDLNEPGINAARQHWAQTQPAQTNVGAIRYEVIAVEEMAERHPQAFDVLTCMELLEHVPDPVSVVSACAKLIKPNGHLFFSTINRNPKAYVFAILGAEYLLRLIPKGTHDFGKFIKPSELAGWARQAGLTVSEFKGLHYQPFTKRYFLNEDISVNYLVHCQRTAA